MAPIGVIWAPIWAPIWGPIWAQTAAPPTVYSPPSGHTAFGGGGGPASRKLYERINKSIEAEPTALAILPASTKKAALAPSPTPAKPAAVPSAKPHTAEKPVEAPLSPDTLKQLQAMLALMETILKEVKALQAASETRQLQFDQDAEDRAVVQLLL